MNRVIIADRIHCPGQQAGRLARQVENARLLLVAFIAFFQFADAIVGRGRQVHQQHHRQIAQVPCNTDIDPRIRHDAATNIDHRAHRGIDVEFVAILIAALAYNSLRL